MPAKTKEDYPGSSWASQRASLQVLAVDDDPDVLDLLSISLESLDLYKVTVATEAEAALQAMHEHERPYDCVILDIQMPGISGVELCAIIRSTPGYRDVPVIMLTAMTDCSHLQNAFAKGASDYVTKPFDMDDIRVRFARERKKRSARAHMKVEHVPRAPMFGNLDRETAWSLDDAIMLQGVNRCISRDSFQSFVLRASERFGPILSLRAVKVVEIFRIFQELPRDEFQSFLQRIAITISGLVAETNEIMTYLGNGIFIIGSVSRSELDLTTGALNVGESKDFMALRERGLPLKLIVGATVPVNVASKADMILSFNRAIELAEMQEIEESNWSSFREWLAHSRSIGREQARVETSAYQELLNDFMDEGHLGWNGT